jgi:hypothetical protein
MPKKKNYIDNRLCSNMGLIPIKINKTIFSDIIKKNKKIFSKFDETNNGVISNCSILLKCNNSKKKGGRQIDTASNYREPLLHYCTFMKQYSKGRNDINLENDFMLVYLQTLNKIFKKNREMTITDIPQIQRSIYGTIKTSEDQKKMDMIHEFFIEEFKNQYRMRLCADGNREVCKRIEDELDPIIITINYGTREWDITGAEYDGSNSAPVNIIFDHMGYNKNIVCAYEQKYIDNKNIMLKFIEDQKTYIKSMTKVDKIVINDYTEYHTFTLYYQYISRGNNKKWLNDYKTYVSSMKDRPHDPFTFGDSFYKQILELYPKKFESKIGVFDSIDDYWSSITINDYINRSPRYSLSLFNDLTQDEWEKVIQKFITDVNDIILKTPILENDIYCYRGSSVHYIKHNDADFNEDHIRINKTYANMFLSSRLSSYSLNFDKSYHYLMKSDEPHKRCMYRTVITKDTPVLFIPSISDAPDELEILTPINCLIAYRKYENGQAEPFEKHSFNNRHKKYALCSTEEFNSADIIIYPPKVGEQAQSSEELDSNDWEGKIDPDNNEIIIFTRK